MGHTQPLHGWVQYLAVTGGQTGNAAAWNINGQKILFTVVEADLGPENTKQEVKR